MPTRFTDDELALIDGLVAAGVGDTRSAVIRRGDRHDSVATFDNLAAVPKSVLTRRLGELGAHGRRKICTALDALADC